jgi:hypothetical protein
MGEGAASIVSRTAKSCSLFQCFYWLLVLLLLQIFCMFDRLLFLVLVFALFAAFVSHGVPPLVLPVILLRFGNLCSSLECYQKRQPKTRVFLFLQLCASVSLWLTLFPINVFIPFSLSKPGILISTECS